MHYQRWARHGDPLTLGYQKKHGMRKSPEYVVWVNMKARCYNDSFVGYHNYGGRGISVCDRWRNNFSAFFEDMGRKPEWASLDRVDPNGNYEPGNCRWADGVTQGNNRTNNRLVTINGETRSLSEWARLYGQNPRTVNARVNQYGWSPLAALAAKGMMRKKTAERLAIVASHGA